MSASIPPLSDPAVNALSEASAAALTPDVSRQRQKELAVALLEDVAAAPLPDAALDAGPKTPRVYG